MHFVSLSTVNIVDIGSVLNEEELKNTFDINYSNSIVEMFENKKKLRYLLLFEHFDVIFGNSLWGRPHLVTL